MSWTKLLTKMDVIILKIPVGSSLAVQQQGGCVSIAGGTGSIPHAARSSPEKNKRQIKITVCVHFL